MFGEEADFSETLEGGTVETPVDEVTASAPNSLTQEDVGKTILLGHPVDGQHTGKLISLKQTAKGQVAKVRVGKTDMNFLNREGMRVYEGEDAGNPDHDRIPTPATKMPKNSGRTAARAQSVEGEEKPARAPKAAPVARLCASGSGAQTKGGFFAPGGDAKLKSLIKKIERGEASVEDLAPISREFLEQNQRWNELFGHILAADFKPTPVVKTPKTVANSVDGEGDHLNATDDEVAAATQPKRK